LVEGKRSKAGRNNSGEITMRHRGGGHKRKLRLIELNKSIYSSFEVTRIEYDPNRTAKIALCKILNSNNYFYILASEEIRVGNIYSGNFDKSDNYPKISQRLKFLPTGSSIFNIIGTYAKSAGVNSVLLKNLDDNKTLIRLPSKKILTVSSDSLAQLGRVSNGLHSNIALGKAGASR
jgi:large subunit ribosomal protein L2